MRAEVLGHSEDWTLRGRAEFQENRTRENGKFTCATQESRKKEKQRPEQKIKETKQKRRRIQTQSCPAAPPWVLGPFSIPPPFPSRGLGPAVRAWEDNEASLRGGGIGGVFMLTENDISTTENEVALLFPRVEDVLIAVHRDVRTHHVMYTQVSASL